VAGAAVTTGLADWPGVAESTAEGLSLGVTAEGLSLGVVALAVLLGWLVAVVETAPEGDNDVGVADGKDCAGAEPEQAETDKDARMVKVAQPTVSLAARLVPVMVVRIFTGSSASAIKVKHIDAAGMQWSVHHWNIRLRD
jgi:hypothetical protein